MPAIYYGREVHVSGRIFSFLPDGTAPFDIISTTLCTNLNSDLLDGEHAAAFQGSSVNLASLAGLTFSAASFVKMTSADTFALDTSVYLTAEADTLNTVTGREATTANALTTGAITLSSATGVSLTGADGKITFTGKKSGGSTDSLSLDFDDNLYLWPTFSSTRGRVKWKTTIEVEGAGSAVAINCFRATSFDTVGSRVDCYWAFAKGTHATSDITGFVDEIDCDTTNGTHKAFWADANYNTPTLTGYYGFYGDSTDLVCPAKYGFYLKGAPNYTNGATTVDANLTLGVTADRVLTFAGATDNCVLTYTSASNQLSFGDTNILTTGTLGAGAITGTSLISPIHTSASGAISFDNENLTTTGNITGKVGIFESATITKTPANDEFLGVSIIDPHTGSSAKLGTRNSDDSTYCLGGLWFNASSPSYTNYAIIDGGSGQIAFNSIGGARSAVDFRISNATYMRITENGNVGIRMGYTNSDYTAYFMIGAGTSAASTAPLKFTTGTSMTTAEAGAMEFTTDDLFFTITTGAARKAFILDNGTRLTSGKYPIASTNGRLIDGQTPLAGTKVYYVADSSGGAVTRKLTFINGILTSET